MKAHPRVGGENEPASNDPWRPRGSSPRGRGKHQGRRERRRRVGLIPAWAGKTNRPPVHWIHAPAHPRVGGENWPSCRSTAQGSGSSPRGRGKHPGRRVLSYTGGLIPAWAGKTEANGRGNVTDAAHPRVGGENPTVEAAVSAYAGSSPRGRGKLLVSGGLFPPGGLIPAWAGKTLPSS